MLLLLLRSPSAASSYADLFEAAAAALADDAPLAILAPGGVWADFAPIGTAMPYLVLSEPDGRDDNESNTGSLEAITLQLSVFAVGKPSARAVRVAAKAILQDAALTFTDGTLLHLRASDRLGMMDPVRGPGGRDVWHEVQMFQAVVGRGGQT